MLTADKKYFKKVIASFPLCAGEEAILGNTIIALGNIGDTTITSKLEQTFRHIKPKIRAYTAWALGKIGGEKAINILHNALLTEKNNTVIKEIQYALNYNRK